MVLADVRHATPTPLGNEVHHCKCLGVLSDRRTWKGEALGPHKLDPREPLADAWKVNFQINSRGHEPDMKVETGCTILQFQILADKQQHQLGFRVCCVGCCDCLGYMLMSRFHSWPYLEQPQTLRHWCLDHRSLNRDNFNHNCHNASGDNGWSMTVARMLVIPLRQRTTHFQ